MTGGLPAGCVVCECLARDGLQHEPGIVPLEGKVEAIERLADLGFRRIEATSFSHPGRVPQFADAEEVLRRIRRRPGVIYKATCVNATAVRRAAEAAAAGHGPSEISLVVSASEAHSRRNVRRTHREMRDQLREALRLARTAGLPAVGTVATAFGCPFTGPVALEQVEAWVELFTAHDVTLISLADTTGMGNPLAVEERFGQLRERWPGVRWIGHFHDTRGTGIANCVAALRAGVHHLDSAFGGLGGHPPGIVYGRGDTGNVATEDLVALLDDMGVETGIDVERLLDGVQLAERTVGRSVGGKVARAGLTRHLLAGE
ncbi:MAG: hydroxymethylglutaryl-CoA lyase [Solirubrobacteraceae bacterium]